MENNKKSKELGRKMNEKNKKIHGGALKAAKTSSGCWQGQRECTRCKDRGGAGLTPSKLDTTLS